MRGVKELVVLARLVFLELPLRKPRLRFETQDPRLKRLVGFLLLLLLFFPPRPFDGPCTSSNMDRARNRLNVERNYGNTRLNMYNLLCEFLLTVRSFFGNQLLVAYIFAQR